MGRRTDLARGSPTAGEYTTWSPARDHSAEIGSTSSPTRTLRGTSAAITLRATRRRAWRSVLRSQICQRVRPRSRSSGAGTGPRISTAPPWSGRAATASRELGEPLRRGRDLVRVRAVDPDGDQPAVRRVAELARAPPTRRAKNCVVVVRGRRDHRRGAPAGRSGSSRGPGDRRARPGRRPARAAGTCARRRGSRAG